MIKMLGLYNSIRKEVSSRFQETTNNQKTLCRAKAIKMSAFPIQLLYLLHFILSVYVTLMKTGILMTIMTEILATAL